MGKKQPKKKKEENPEVSPSAGEEPATGSSPTWHIWKILAIVFIVISVGLAIYAYDCGYELSVLDENLGMCFIELENTEMELKDMTTKVDKLERAAEAHGLGDVSKNPLPEKYIQQFKDKGLLSPENNLLNDLYHNTEIIPYNEPGNFGFRFTDRRLLYLLSPNRAFANFASQDVKGWLYLSYKVKGKGDIEWKVIESYCPDLDK
jgi:hypothetical protein